MLGSNSKYRTIASCAIAALIVSFYSGEALSQLPKLPPLKQLGRSMAKSGGTGSRKEKKNALESLPWASMTPDAAARIQSVVNQPTIYRRLPIKSIDTDPQLFLLLIRNPEIVIDIWQQMNATQLTLDRVGDFEFRATDGAGTTSKIDLVYGTPNVHVYLGSGVYEGPLFKQDIRGQCVMLLRTDYVKVNGRNKARNRLDVFLKLDSGMADVVGKSIAPLFGRTADINFTETCGFIGKLSYAAETNGPRMQDLAARMRTVSRPVKQKFVAVASTVNERANTAGQMPRARIARPPNLRGDQPVRPVSNTQPSGQPLQRAARRPIVDSRIEMPVLR